MPDLQDLNVEWVSLVDRAAVRDPEDTSEPMRFLVWKRDNTQQGGGGHMPQTPEELRAALEKAEQERDELKGKVDKAESDAAEMKEALEKAQADIEALKKEEPEAAEVSKADLSPEWRERIEKMEADQAADRERAEKAEKIAKAEREERLRKEFIAKAESFEALPVEKDEFGPLLQRAHEVLSKEDFEALETVLKAADAQVKASDLFKEQGRTRAGEQEGALAEARQKAEELKKADSSLSDAAALDRVLSSDRDLQERYLAEVR